MLTLKNVTKEFNGLRAVDHVSFQVKKGEVVGFLGPNAAGKTTTMRLIATLLEPNQGEILLNGKNVHQEPLLIKKHLGYLPENNPLYEDMLVCEYLDFVASSRSLKGLEKKKAIDQAIQETGVLEVFYKPINELSKGYQQRVGLAQTILHTPDILIMDEPTEGLDPNQRVEIRKLIKKIGRERTVILSTHVLQEVKATCNRVIIINKGRIVADGTVEELSARAKAKSIITLGAQGLKDPQNLKKIKGIKSIKRKRKSGSDFSFELVVQAKKDIRLEIFDLAKKQGWRIWELHQEEVSLEDVFRQLTVK